MYDFQPNPPKRRKLTKSKEGHSSSRNRKDREFLRNTVLQHFYTVDMDIEQKLQKLKNDDPEPISKSKLPSNPKSIMDYFQKVSK